MKEDIKEDYKDLKKRWKVYKKNKHRCTLNELYLKEEFAKHMMYTFVFTFLFLISQMLFLFYYENTASITVNTMVLVSLIALYDEAQNRNYIQMLIYHKEREEIQAQEKIEISNEEYIEKPKEEDVDEEINRIILEAEKRES